jgi:Predicted membrane protein
MNLIAWIVLGAIAGYLAGFLVKGDEGLGIIGHIALGIVGALVGGFLAGLLLNVKDPIQGPIDLGTILIAVIGAIIVVAIAQFATGRGGLQHRQA